MQDREGKGIFMTDFLVLLRYPEVIPWIEAVPEKARRSTLEKKIPDGIKAAFWMHVPEIDTTRYLPYLQRQFEILGGRLIRQTILSIEELLQDADWIVNCTGLGAKASTQDQELYPVKGQILSIKRKMPLTAFSDDQDLDFLAYAIPCLNDVILGGTAYAMDESIKIESADSERIMQRCRKLFGNLSEIEILQEKVDLRPSRSSVRLEKDLSLPVVHNYGHGGSGYTVSWGCAEKVVEIIS